MKLYYDLHLHSCLSPCGDNDMSPYNLTNMAKLLGYDIIALTDHNSCENCESAIKIGKEIGLTVVPGMELCTSEEIHNVCLFPTVEKAMEFSRFIKATMPPVKNREEIFGQQLIMDTEDGILGKEEILLTVASSVSIDELPDELTPNADEQQWRENYPALEGKTLIRSSDAHYLQNMREAEFTVDLPENSAEALISFIRNNK